MTAIDDAKNALRARAGEIRRAAHRAQGRAAADAVCRGWQDALAKGMAPPRGAAVAGYWPVRDELDVRSLLRGLAEGGATVALPAVVGPDRPVVFRRWRPGDTLVTGAYGLSEPDTDAPAIVPQLLIVPLLAFDRAGYRLGSGRGYYDRTLRALRGGPGALAVGVGFAAQEVPEVPHDGYDERLDWIVTEAGAKRLG